MPASAQSHASRGSPHAIQVVADGQRSLVALEGGAAAGHRAEQLASGNRVHRLQLFLARSLQLDLCAPGALVQPGSTAPDKQSIRRAWGTEAPSCPALIPRDLPLIPSYRMFTACRRPMGCMSRKQEQMLENKAKRCELAGLSFDWPAGWPTWWLATGSHCSPLSNWYIRAVLWAFGVRLLGACSGIDARVERDLLRVPVLIFLLPELPPMSFLMELIVRCDAMLLWGQSGWDASDGEAID
jgi:hypothetical protein